MSLDIWEKQFTPVDLRLRSGDPKDVCTKFNTDVYRWMLDTRNNKYSMFLWELQGFRYLIHNSLRADLMENYYCHQRCTDDIADGDHPLPVGYPSPSAYVQKRLDFARDPSSGPKDVVDQVLLRCYQLAERLGFSVQSETILMLQSILFDADRRGKNTEYPQAVLDKNFDDLDGKGTVSLSLKFFGEDKDHEKKLHLLRPLATATRMHYSIDDLKTDLLEGVRNISAEDMAKHGITDAALRDPHSPAVQAWKRQEALKGMDLLKQHERNLHRMKLRWFTPSVLQWVFRKRAQKCFRQVLNGD